MKKLSELLVLGAFLAVAAPAAMAQVSVSSSIFYGSPYVWRGEVLSSGFVVQPAVEASYGGFSLGFFGNLDPNGGSKGQTYAFNEADLTAAYGTSFSGVDIGVGYTFYTFPGYAADELELSPTQEFFGSIGLADVPLTPSLLVAYDFDAFSGLYAEAGVGHTVNSGSQPINLGASLGFDSGYVLEDGESAITHLGFTADTDFEAGSITISPLVGIQVHLDDTYRSANAGYGFGNTTFLWGGIGISW